MASEEAEDGPDELLDGMTAQQILKRMGAVYAACRTYEDAGVVESVSVDDERRRLEITLFETVFERSNCFRFEYNRGNERYILWSVGKRVKPWWNISSGGKLLLWMITSILPLLSRKQHPLVLGLAGATGISRGAAHTIPALLFPELKINWPLTSLMHAVRLDDNILEGVHCMRVQGRYVGDWRMLWIDRDTFLLRRIDTQYKNTQTEETTYYPVVNQPVDPRKFVFRPSQKRAD